MDKKANVIKNIIGTISLPVIMYVIMLIFCWSNGKTFFGTWTMWRALIPQIASVTACAMGIGLQFKNGRFDFSGGSIMLLTIIIVGNMAKAAGNNITVLFFGCLIVSVVLSVLVALVYTMGRLPIVIATLAMALIYESFTPVIFGGNGINLVPNLALGTFSKYPGILVPFVGAVGVYAAYNYLLKSGKQSQLLANNQQAAVNIGINEQKNVIISYVCTGLIFGFATIMFAASAPHDASYSSLATVGQLFSNILPVFVGLYIGVFCGDTIGIIMASTTIALMMFGLQAVLKAEMGSAVSTAMMGIFVLIVNVVAGPESAVRKQLVKIFSRAKAANNIK